MTRQLYFANTDFEFELAANGNYSIESSWKRHPICFQLQYLPLLFADPEDYIAVTNLPTSAFIEHVNGLTWRRGEALPKFQRINHPEPIPNCQCISWGYSESVEKWALQRQFTYSIPIPWKRIQEINSKLWSHQHSPLLGSKLLWNRIDLQSWMEESLGQRVLKTCFGLSGHGNKLIDDSTSLATMERFCQKEWHLKRPIIAEPWLERCLDFSTQWRILPDGSYKLLGSTIFETSSKGVYNATLAGPEETLFAFHTSFLQEHKRFVEKIVIALSEIGFRGHVGFDAYLYRKENQTYLNPLVEINARQTMSLMALKLQKKYFSEEVIKLSFGDSEDPSPSLLPSEAEDFEGGKLQFKQRLTLTY